MRDPAAAIERPRVVAPRWLPQAPAAAVSFLVVVGLGAASGGFFPESWGWASLGLLWVVSLGLLLRGEVTLSRLQATQVGAATLLTIWTLASAVWSPSATQPVLESERSLVYLAAILACAFAFGRGNGSAAGFGVWGAIAVTCLYSLGTRLMPDRLGLYNDPFAHGRLYAPVGYWNGLAAFAAIGVVLGVGFACRGESVALRALAAASLPTIVLTLYFTFSRGGLLALAFGLLAVVALDPRRVQAVVSALAILPWAGFAVLAASRHAALHTSTLSVARSAPQGHRVAAVVLACSIAAAVAAIVIAVVEPRVPSVRALNRAGNGALLLAGIVVLGVAVYRYGTPVDWVSHIRQALSAPARQVNALSDPSQRLSSLSLNNRQPIWHVAVSEARSHLLLGGGAGSFAAYWVAHRPFYMDVSDAHSLYLETVAELGVIGAAMLTVLLGTIAAAAWKLRRSTYSVWMFGGVVVYLAAAAVDWDWELAAVTAAMLLLGGGLALDAPGRRISLQRPVWRACAVGAVIVLGVLSAIGLVSNVELNRAADARYAGRYAAAEAEARTAASWAPWSSAPIQELGLDELAAGQKAAARAEFRRGLKLDPENWQLWANVAQSSSGRTKAVALAHARRLNPRDPGIQPANTPH